MLTYELKRILASLTKLDHLFPSNEPHQ